MAGSAWTNQAISLLIIQSGGNFQGIFVYSPSPGAGNLSLSISASSGTDPYGNSYPAGFAFFTSAGNIFQSMGVVSGLAAWLAQAITGAVTSPPAVLMSPSSTGCFTNLVSGNSVGGSVAAIVSAIDSTFSGVVNGQIDLIAGKVFIGNSSVASWDDNVKQLLLPVAGGPFVSGESFHTVSNASGFTGTMRVKKLPWNAVWIDVLVSLTGSTGGTFNFGSLPDATYYPTQTRHFPLAFTATPTAVAADPHVTVPTSGAVQITTPSFTSTGGFMSLSVMYPTN